MDKTRITLKGQTFELWVAKTPDQRSMGLMQVTEAELAAFTASGTTQPVEAERGMLFVFPFEQPLSFWMFNTITPLDIAYVRSDGVIVRTYTMAPLETRSYPSVEPARFAIEVRAGLLEKLGVKPGDTAEIPESVLKGVS